MVLGIRAVGETVLRGTGVEPASFLARWCREQFGPACAPDAAALYEDLFAAYFVRESAELPDEHILLDGMAKMVGAQARHILCGIVWEPKVEFQKRILNIGSEDEFLDYYFRGTGEGLARLYSLHGRLLDLLPRVPAERQSFFTANLPVQTKILIGLYEHAHFMCAAARARRAGEDPASWRLHAARAVHGLENAIDACARASHGKWRHWYRGDKKLDLRSFRDASREILRQEDEKPIENQTTS